MRSRIRGRVSHHLALEFWIRHCWVCREQLGERRGVAWGRVEAATYCCSASRTVSDRGHGEATLNPQLPCVGGLCCHHHHVPWWIFICVPSSPFSLIPSSSFLGPSLVLPSSSVESLSRLSFLLPYCLTPLLSSLLCLVLLSHIYLRLLLLVLRCFLLVHCWCSRSHGPPILFLIVPSCPFSHNLYLCLLLVLLQCFFLVLWSR